MNIKNDQYWPEKHNRKVLTQETMARDREKAFAEYMDKEIPQKTYGVPCPVWPSNFKEERSDAQTKLLKTVVEFLNQASTSLYFSNNRFLASSAKDLAAQLSDKFCIG